MDSTEEMTPTERGFAAWRSAMRWLRSVDAALRPLGLTHTRYLVLHAAEQLVSKYNDAVPQWEIAELAGVDEGTASSVARRLELDGLLDRGPDGLDARFSRILVSTKGAQTVGRARVAIDAVSVRFFGTPCRRRADRV